jgi:hypothetical protein
VKGAIERDDRRSARRGASDLDSVLHGFGAGRREKGFHWPVAPNQTAEPLSQTDIRFVHHHLKARVHVSIELVLDGRNNPRVVVPNIDDANAGREVEIFLPVGVPDLATLRAHGEDGVGGCHPCGDPFIAGPEQR